MLYGCRALYGHATLELPASHANHGGGEVRADERASERQRDRERERERCGQKSETALQLKAQGPSRTCIESKEEEEKSDLNATPVELPCAVASTSMTPAKVLLTT